MINLSRNYQERKFEVLEKLKLFGKLKFSKILLKANLSHTDLKRIEADLTQEGLLNLEKKYYSLTDKAYIMISQPL